MDKKNITPANARNESVVFDELQSLCCSPGYLHAIAYFCWRDNLIRFAGDQVTEDDVRPQYSRDHLTRTEISTLIGLMAKGEINTTIPPPQVLQGYVDRSEALLHEMQMSLQKPWWAAFEAAARNSRKSDQTSPSPFSTADGLREPMFYGSESAYDFQYRELAPAKYRADDDWLTSHVGFTIDQASLFAKALHELQLQKLLGLRETMRAKPPAEWTFLPGFQFTAQEVDAVADIEIEIIERIISAFSLERTRKNEEFVSPGAFNETNAAPIITLSDGACVLFQNYSLLEAMYEAPFFWMVGDKSYRDTASKNRGAFAEQFLADRLARVFGSQHILQNVDIYRGKDRLAEADVLVLYGNQAIVVEAKAKRLTIEARKGNDRQLKDDFKKAIHDAYAQAQLCAEAMLDETCRFVLASGDEVSFSRRPSRVFPLCVVSDHYPALAIQARQFLEIKTTDIIQPPVVTDCLLC